MLAFFSAFCGAPIEYGGTVRLRAAAAEHLSDWHGPRLAAVQIEASVGAPPRSGSVGEPMARRRSCRIHSV